MLTLREANVLSLLAAGCSKKQIAARLGISAHTVVSHVRNTYRKLQVNPAAAAVMRAVQLQILSPDLVRELQAGGCDGEIPRLGDAQRTIQ
jgi:LuxR family transcriptional regulator, positive regulator of biofilm formation